MKSKNKLTKKIKKEVWRWISMKLSITSDLKNLEEQPSLNILDRLETLWGKRLKLDARREKRNNKRRNSSRRNWENKLYRGNKNSKRKFYKSLYLKNKRIKKAMTGSFAMTAAKVLRKENACGNVKNVRISCFAMTVMSSLFTSILLLREWSPKVMELLLQVKIKSNSWSLVLFAEEESHRFKKAINIKTEIT